MRYIMMTILSAALILPLVGCDKQVSQEKSTSHNPITGSSTTEDKTTYQRPDGSTYTNTSEHTSH